MNNLILGILAHVDSGKTTLSEAILYKTGLIRSIGRVDSGNSFMDTDEIEKDRGITIFSNSATARFKDSDITLLDTPGHIDFSPEAERTLGVIDCAVLLISGLDGVQSHTETLWRLLEKYRVPTFIFINKMDISQIGKGDLIKSVKERLSDRCISFLENDDLSEELALTDEEIFEAFESGEIPKELIREKIQRRKIFPIVFGSALKLSGIDELLETITEFAPKKTYGEAFGAKVYKITRDKQGERLTHLKITGGALNVKDILSGTAKDGREFSEKVNQIRLQSGASFKPISTAQAGSICVVSGLSYTFQGQGFGIEKTDEGSLMKPVLNYKVLLPSGADAVSALSKFRILEQEEPQLNVSWNTRLSEINFSIMGEVQLEVIKRLIKDRFSMDVEFSYSSIAYRETIRDKVVGVGHYEPLKHYAEVQLELSPLPQGSGIVFEASLPENALDRNWQRLILTHLHEKTHIGVLTGSPITDMKVSLIAGRAHLKHTEGGDFREATYRAVRNGLRKAESVLLEPWYDFRLEIPEDTIGRAMTDLERMSATFFQPVINGGFAVITGSCPVVTMRGYLSEVISYTKGKGRLSMMPKGYFECKNADYVIKEIAYNPDADLENTADSVFCSHGAGFSVPWQDVDNFKHIDFEKEKKEQEEVKVRRYISRAMDDSELKKIFEMTYGKVEKPLHTVFKTEKVPEKPYKSTKKPIGSEYLLVDGYNIIFAWDELKALSEKSLDLARETLIRKLCNYRGFCDFEIILVFDAYKVKHNLGEVEHVHNISVVYTKEAETADMYIEKVTHELSKNHKVRVATSDGLEQIIILGAGCLRVSATEFKKELDSAEENIKKYLETL